MLMLLRGCIEHLWITARWHVLARRDRHGATYTTLHLEPRHSELGFVSISNFVNYRGEICIKTGRYGEPKSEASRRNEMKGKRKWTMLDDEAPKEAEKRRTLGEVLSWLMENIFPSKSAGLVQGKPENVPHEPRRRRVLRNMKRRSRQINAAKARG